MPELPEVETIRIGLERLVQGATIATCEVVGFPGVIEPLNIDQFSEAIADRQIVALQRRAKYLLLGLDNDLSIVIHLRMTGQLLVCDAQEEPSRFERFRFELRDGRQLRFLDQRKFGRLLLATPAELAALDRRLGIEPLSDEFTADWLSAALVGRKGQIKPLLLDQSVIAGIGNIYADEALFRSGIHPQSTAGALSGDQVSSLCENLRFVLRGAIDRGGTTFSSYRNATGESGTNQLALQIYGLGRSESPCPRCGGRLQCLTVAGRSSHVCPVCQPLPG